jgi:Domain of unknown function (DUF1918)
MKAEVGDRLVTEGQDGPRECQIIRLQNTDGSPPYVVRWLADGHIALVFPGPFTRLVHSLRAEPANVRGEDVMRGEGDRPEAGHPREVQAGQIRAEAARVADPLPGAPVRDPDAGAMAENGVRAGRIRLAGPRFGIAWPGPLWSSHGLS